MNTISYEPFDELIASLKEDGLTEEAIAMDHMLHHAAWTTGSELLGELGQKITTIRKEDASWLSAETKIKMKKSMDIVKIVWPGFPEH